MIRIDITNITVQRMWHMVTYKESKGEILTLAAKEVFCFTNSFSGTIISFCFLYSCFSWSGCLEELVFQKVLRIDSSFRSSSHTLVSVPLNASLSDKKTKFRGLLLRIMLLGQILYLLLTSYCI